MIHDFIKKGVSVIQNMRSRDKKKRSDGKDLAFNLITHSDQKLALDVSNAMVFVTVETYLSNQSSKILLEQFIFSYQPHEKRKHLNLMSSPFDLESKLTSLLKSLSQMLLILPAYREETYTELKTSFTSIGNLVDFTVFQFLTNLIQQGSFSSNFEQFPRKDDEFSLFLVDHGVRKFGFKVIWIKEWSTLELRRVEWIQEVKEQELSLNICDTVENDYVREVLQAEHDKKNRPRCDSDEGAFINLDLVSQVRKLSQECSQNYICDYLQYEEDDEIADFLLTLLNMSKLKIDKLNVKIQIDDIQTFFYKLQ